MSSQMCAYGDCGQSDCEICTKDSVPEKTVSKNDFVKYDDPTTGEPLYRKKTAQEREEEVELILDILPRSAKTTRARAKELLIYWVEQLEGSNALALEQIRELQTDLDRVTRENEEMRKAIEHLEFGKDGRCPVCRTLFRGAHGVTCNIGKALKR